MAETLRWLRAGRDRGGLDAHLRHRFPTFPGETLNVDAIVQWLALRRLLYLDDAPSILPPTVPEHPLSAVYWVCTQKCNLRCTYCYQEATVARPNELTTDEALGLVDQVVEAGASTFVITGGEPFSRRDMMQVASYSKSRGLATNVITNGGYITAKSVGQVAEVFDLVTISLDHVKPEHHDRFRGKGSWEHAARAIDLLLEKDVPVEVNSTLTAPGYGDLQELLQLSRQKRIRRHKIVPQFPMGRASLHRGDELEADDLLRLNDEMYSINEQLDSDQPRQLTAEGTGGDKGSHRLHCGAGLSEVSVDPEGWVYPCRLLQYQQFRSGSIRDSRLIDIYQADPSIRGVQRTTVKQLQPCATCIIRDACGGGCRGIHFSFTNDYLKAHPLFCAYLRRSFEVKAWKSTGNVPLPRGGHYTDTESATPGNRRQFSITPV
jgi:radical SAM protein with 4Fe4S-binding SPASM domain